MWRKSFSGNTSLLMDFERVLTVVYNGQDYRFFGLCPSFAILEKTTFLKLDLLVFPYKDVGC
jgi:hypothetical protein